VSAVERLFRTNVAYKRLFLNEDGTMKPEARIVLADLAKYAAIDNPTVVSPLTQQTDIPATHQRIGRGDILRRVLTRLKQSPSAMLETMESIRDE